MASADFWWNFQRLPEHEPIKLYGGVNDDDDETYSEELDQKTNVFGGTEVNPFEDADIEESVFGDVDID